jgi:hypothetical protein
VAGCAGGTAIYDKPGLTYAEWRRDDADCRRASHDSGAGVDREPYARCMGARGYRIRAE